MLERWKQLPGFHYQISNHGRVRTVDKEVFTKEGIRRVYKGKLIKTFKKDNELYFYIVRDGRPGKIKLAKVMLKLFLNKEAKYIDYKDGNMENCKIDNLGILNGAYKLNKQKIEEIYHKRLAGEKLIVLSLEYGISKDTIVRIIKRGIQ